MFSRKTNAAPVPCVVCHKEEMKILRGEYDDSVEDDFWVYRFTALNCCKKCDRSQRRHLWNSYPSIRSWCCESPYTHVDVPIKVKTVGIIERAVESSKVATAGSDYKAHGAFVAHITRLECPELYKQSLIRWAPSAIIAFEGDQPGASRRLRKGQPAKQAESQASTPKAEGGVSHPDGVRPPPGLSVIQSAGRDPDQELMMPPANDDCDSTMKGTVVDEDAYGEENRVTGEAIPVENKVLGIQVGPSIIETEVMESCVSNLKAGLAKRVQPLPFKAGAKMEKKIYRTVTALMDEVFSAKKIKEWREENPCIDDFKSKKWSGERWRLAIEDAFADIEGRIEQTFQIKTNEALPANAKAPRPIIQCGDRAQVMMALPVKCFEELLFHHFEEASIKHVPKYEAMERVAKRLNLGEKCQLIEGDGSAWDSCCNAKIRKMTENRIIKHIINVLGEDPEVPKLWMDKMLEDMEKNKLGGKAKVSDTCITPIKVLIDAIRQSGHRGTSCFNYLINLVCWLCVISDEPWELIKKDRYGKLPSWYKSAFDKKYYKLAYAFEGDDSALASTEDFTKYQELIEENWTKLGFRMKLVFVKEKLTFTGFDFLCDSKGPVGAFLPEIPRNIASASWSCSSELRQFPERVHRVGAAAMLARAENFKDCGPFSRYFAALGLAHVTRTMDSGIGEEEAVHLGIAPVASIRDALQELYDSAVVCEGNMQKLLDLIVPMSEEQMIELVTCQFDDPYDYIEARRVLPFQVWDPSNFKVARRPGRC